MKNKEEVVQCLVLHYTILKHKVIIDQMRKGLSILGLQKELEKAPSMFEPFFVHSNEDISASYVKALLKPPKSDNSQEKNVLHMLYAYIENASKDDLAEFLLFVTGSKTNTSLFIPGSITVSFGNTEAIFASTCTLELKLPSNFASYSLFETSMAAVVKAKSKKFTTP